MFIKNKFAREVACHLPGFRKGLFGRVHFSASSALAGWVAMTVIGTVDGAVKEGFSYLRTSMERRRTARNERNADRRADEAQRVAKDEAASG